MILRTCRGKELYHLVYKDFKTSVTRQIKKERDKAREPFLKKKMLIEDLLWISFYYQAPSYNKWFIRTALQGDPKLPKSHIQCHCITQAGPKDSRMYIIFRGWKTAKAKTGGIAGGYIVSVLKHAIDKMRERGPREWAWLKDDELMTKIFTMDERGIYYDFDWTKYSVKKTETAIPLVVEEVQRPEWMLAKEKEAKEKIKEIPIVLRTLAGFFLGWATEDRSEVRLITYLGDGNDLENEDEREALIEFLTPAWITFNPEVFPEDKVKEARSKLDVYMDDKINRNVYILAI